LAPTEPAGRAGGATIVLGASMAPPIGAQANGPRSPKLARRGEAKGFVPSRLATSPTTRASAGSSWGSRQTEDFNARSAPEECGRRPVARGTRPRELHPSPSAGWRPRRMIGDVAAGPRGGHGSFRLTDSIGTSRTPSSADAVRKRIYCAGSSSCSGQEGPPPAVAGKTHGADAVNRRARISRITPRQRPHGPPRWAGYRGAGARRGELEGPGGRSPRTRGHSGSWMGRFAAVAPRGLGRKGAAWITAALRGFPLLFLRGRAGKLGLVGKAVTFCNSGGHLLKPGAKRWAR